MAQDLIGDTLVRMGYLAEHELEAGLEAQRHRGGVPRLGEILVEQRACDEEQVAKAVACQAGLKYCRISKFQVPAQVVAMVPRGVAEDVVIFPLKVGRRALIVAADAPLDFFALDNLRFLLGTEVEVVIASTAEIQEAIDTYYGGSSPRVSLDDLKVISGSGLFGRALSTLVGEIEVLLRADCVRLSGERRGVRVQHELRLSPELQERLLHTLHLDPGVLAAARTAPQHVSLPEGVDLRVRAFASPDGRSLAIQRA